MSRRLEVALSCLELDVSRGVEFPDACSRIATRMGVDYDALRAAYDEAQRADFEDTQPGVYEEPDLIPCDVCPACEGQPSGLGTLGSLQWFRCRSCGFQFSA